MTQTDCATDRRNSTILNPRGYLTDDLWIQAPILTGSTKFEPLDDAKNILVTGGAGFMYVGVAIVTILKKSEHTTDGSFMY